MSADQPQFAADFDPATHGAIPSPCVNICKINAVTQLCEGCLRTIDEITQWRTASEEYKHAVWLRIAQRKYD